MEIVNNEKKEAIYTEFYYQNLIVYIKMKIVKLINMVNYDAVTCVRGNN